MAETGEEDLQYGVLLYYKYVQVPDLHDLLSFYDSNCNSLRLLGRVRLSSNGVNVTVGGELSALKKHIEAVKSNRLFDGTDFKLACSHRPLNDKVSKECGFASLSIRVVKELVTFHSHPLLKSPEVSNVGKHLSATEFHSVLQSPGTVLEESGVRWLQHILDQRALVLRMCSRVSVGSGDATILGACLLCHSPYDDYSSRTRCTHCRMLVLICDCCQQKGDIQYVCELCQKQGKPAGVMALAENDTAQALIHNDQNEFKSTAFDLEAVSMSDDTRFSPEPSQRHSTGPLQKLRILCLHGFRQNASSFKGRTASLSKKLKHIAELVFVDAPHELSFIYCPSPTEHHSNCKSPESPPPSKTCRKKFAWFVAPDYKERVETDWEVTDTPFDPLQYQQQTGGFSESLAYLKTVHSRVGPFDGILGFSQGAAMAALLCAQGGRTDDEMCFKFAILCSGYAPSQMNFDRGSFKCPSLHIFGNDTGKDRQISSQASRNLASFFEGSRCAVIEHEYGHIIPTRSPYIDEIRGFLRRFL